MMEGGGVVERQWVSDDNWGTTRKRNGMEIKDNNKAGAWQWALAGGEEHLIGGKVTTSRPRRRKVAKNQR